MENIIYYELATEYGPLYIYEKYKNDPKQSIEVPETREFFTQEEALVGYGTLSFLDDSNFKTVDRNSEGIITKKYMTKLTPYEFLDRVGAYIGTDEEIREKRNSIYRIFNMKANNIENDQIITEQKRLSQEQKDCIASKILTKYLAKEPNRY